jgi:hypothetical protein
LRVPPLTASLHRWPGALLGLLVLALPAWLFAGWLLLAQGNPVEASETIRGLHMRVLVPHETGWESVDLQMLLLDDGSEEWEMLVEEARTGMLARIPGAIEATPNDVTGQFETLGWRWGANMAHWHYNPAGAPGHLEPVAEEIFTTAAETWTFVENADFAFYYLGQTESGSSMCNGSQRDGLNVVTWADLPGSVLGVTCVPSRSDTVEFDMQFDFERPWSFDLEDVSIDLPSVATHEFGHALGLAHTRDRDAVMYASYSRGSLKRVLQPDDIEGLKDVYGELAGLPIFEEGDVRQSFVPGLRRE